MNRLIENSINTSSWMIVLLAIIVLIVFLLNAMISAYITSYLTAYREKQRYKKTKVERLQQFTTSTLPDGIRTRAEKKLSAIGRTKKKSIFLSVGLATLIIILLFVMNNTFRDGRRGTYQDIIQNIDNMKTSLRQKTVMKSVDTVCADSPKRDLQRTRAQTICILETNDSGSDPLAMSKAYALCMMKQGWVVSHCQKGDQDCVTLRTGAGNKILLKTEQDNILPQCLVAEPEEDLVARWEAICSWRAFIEGIDKATRHEAQRITTVALSYKACMLEQGWSTQQCTANQPGCVEIPYREGMCTARIRDWLEHKYSYHDPFLHMCLGRENPSLM